MADDIHVVRAAKVSTQGTKSLDSEENEGLINYLMKNKHASPFEHSTFTFYINAPIFVTREILRHRSASFNEESGRYKILEPSAYIPYSERPLKQVGKPGNYTFESGDDLRQGVADTFLPVYQLAWESYGAMINRGVAREVARMILPLGIYSTLYMTLNARSLMNFLHLRTPDSALWEIRYIADEMEKHFQEQMPLTHHHWMFNGRGSL